MLVMESKILKKSLHIALYNQLCGILTAHQHGFVRNRLVETNMLSSLKELHEAIAEDLVSETVTFYTNFDRATDKVPHHEFLKTVVGIRVGGCFVVFLFNYLKVRKKMLCVDNTRTIKVKSCARISNRPISLLNFWLVETPVFSDSFTLADDPKLLAIEKNGRN